MNIEISTAEETRESLKLAIQMLKDISNGRFYGYANYFDNVDKLRFTLAKLEEAIYYSEAQ